MQPVRVIAGLGNPGKRYDGTRHNVGFMLLDQLSSKYGGSWKSEARFSAQTAAIEIDGKSYLLMKPETFMNDSGRSISGVCRYFKWHPQSVLVVYDEYQLGIGQKKLSLRGSAGGHNGISSIISHVGEQFPRLRIGIGPSRKPTIRMTDFVLGTFSKEETSQLEKSWEDFLKAIYLILQKGPNLAMNTINQRIRSE